MMSAMTPTAAQRWWSWSAPVTYVLALPAAMGAVAVGDPVAPGELLVTYALLLPSVVTGALIAVRVPASPVGGALAWVGAAPAVVLALGSWGGALLPAGPDVESIGDGLWPLLFTGLMALLLVFPDGLPPGPRWRAVAVLAPGSAVLLSCGLLLDRSMFATEGGPWPGEPLFVLPGPWRVAEVVVLFGGFLAGLVAAVTALVVRFRRGDEVTRLRVRWLMLAAAGLPVLLGVTWLLMLVGLDGDTVVGTGFLVLLLLVVPATVTLAVLRHELFDVDRLLGEGLAWVITTLVSAGVFAAAVALLGEAVGRDSRLGTSGAAFVTALCLLPVHRVVLGAVGRFVDRDRNVVLVRVAQFVEAVRDGSREPEEVEDVLRAVLGDPGVRLLLRRPGAAESGLVDLRGSPVVLPDGVPNVPLHTGDAVVGVLQLGTGSARRLRRAREAAVRARLPIEVSRLRLELRGALEDVRASRSRIVVAAEDERRRLERDLHDGAQQQVVAIGMRLRRVQRGLGRDEPAHAELDAAVEALESLVGELRRLAHGVRPSRLDDGLASALGSLVRSSALPVDLRVGTDVPADLPDLTAATVYFVVAEALSNTHKHARAERVLVEVDRTDGVLQATVGDDGRGGATDGFGLTSLRDRVASAGGALTVHSPPGAGTRVRVELPCGS
jgi:signal transduction histidine kinase